MTSPLLGKIKDKIDFDMHYGGETRHFGQKYENADYSDKNGQRDCPYDCDLSTLPTEIFKTPAGKSSSSIAPHKAVARALFQSQSPTRCDSYNQSYE